MKRSNRLVLLVGVFLTFVAFVGIVLLMTGAGFNSEPQVYRDELRGVTCYRWVGEPPSCVAD